MLVRPFPNPPRPKRRLNTPANSGSNDTQFQQRANHLTNEVEVEKPSTDADAASISSQASSTRTIVAVWITYRAVPTQRIKGTGAN
jgi:hypothetical protein